ncbi:MAG: type II secretion system F family protein [Planctomycetaceae bacterium]|nr:type II secretion system F family protein [Planctomycetaceae bacterium]
MMSEQDALPDDREATSAAGSTGPQEITDWVDAPPASNGRLPLSLLTNLRALSEDMSPRWLRSVLGELSDRVERGEPLSVAFTAVRQRLPKGLVSLFDVGLARGRIDLLLGSYLDHVRRMSDVRASIWTSLSYPVLLTAVVAILGLLLTLFIVPMFTSIFEDFGTELPALTLFYVSLSRMVRQQGLWILLAVIVLAAGAWGLMRAIGGPALPQRLFREIPCFGRVFRWASLAGFTETLAMLVDMQSPLPEALRLAGQTTDDLTLSERAGKLATALEQGKPLGEHGTGRMPLGRELAGVMRWADKPRLFADALRSSGEIFAARSRVELHLLTWLFEPLLLFGVAVMVGLCLIAMFMPLIKLLNDLS